MSRIVHPQVWTRLLKQLVNTSGNVLFLLLCNLTTYPWTTKKSWFELPHSHHPSMLLTNPPPSYPTRSTISNFLYCFMSHQSRPPQEKASNARSKERLNASCPSLSRQRNKPHRPLHAAESCHMTRLWQATAPKIPRGCRTSGNQWPSSIRNKDIEWNLGVFSGAICLCLCEEALGSV